MALRPAISHYQRRGHVLTSSPAVEPVTAAELRTLLNESVSGLPDSEAEAFIVEAREWIEETTALALITQSWRLALDQWPAHDEPWWDGVRQGSIADLHGSRKYSDLDLPRFPLQAVDSVTVYDESSTSASVTIADTFDVDTYRKPGRLTLKRGATWPVALRANNAIEIVYTAGYGDAASDVPAALRSAVKRMAAWLYTNRGDCQEAAEAVSAMKLLSAYRVARL